MNFFVGWASSFGISDYMYLSIMWDTRISDEVYRVRIISCEMIYFILFVGWVYLWAWYIFSLRMRIRIVPTDRIIRIM